MTLPTIAAWLTFGSSSVLNWRLSIALTGIIAALYGVFYFFNVQDTPPGKIYQKPKRARGLEITTPKDE